MDNSLNTFFDDIKSLCILASTDCYRVILTGPKYVKRNEAVHVVCSSNQTPIELSADFLVNGITYTTLRSTKGVCYSAHLRNRCPQTPVNCHCNKDGKEYGLVIRASERNSTMTVSCLMKFQDGGQVLKSDNIIVDIYGTCCSIFYRKKYVQKKSNRCYILNVQKTQLK